MAYTQHFGLSRNSPLSERQSIMQNSDGTAVDVKKEALEKNNPATSIVSGINEKNKNANEMLRTAIATSGSVKPGRESVIQAANEQEAEDAAWAKRQGEKSNWSKGLDALQDTASVAGLVPAYGNVVDIPNALLSGFRTATNAVGDTARGLTGGGWDYSRTKEHALNTALNTTAILPVAGQMATGGRLGVKAMKYANAAKYSAKGMKVAKYTPKVADAVSKYGGVKSGVNIASQGVDSLKNKDGKTGLPPVAKAVGISGLTGKLAAKMASFFN